MAKQRRAVQTVIKARVPEARVLKDCKAVLEFCKAKGYLTYRRISTTGIPMESRSGKRFLICNTMTGMTDLMIFLHRDFGCHTLHVELKGSEGKLSDAQESWRDELAAIGHETYYVAYSRDGLLAVLRLYGVPVTSWCS